MSTGKLYSSRDGQLVGDVNYRLHKDTPASWWGEFTLVDYIRITDGRGYLIELEDKRRGECSLKQRVNRAVSGVPPRYTYRFTGAGPLRSTQE